eukprot:scpid108387/ scgid27330/ 
MDRACHVKRLGMGEIATSQPQAAYSAFTRGLQSKWTFLCRTMPGLAEQLTPLDDAVTNCLVPALLGRQVNDTERAMIALPCRHGGLGLTPPSSVAQQHESSVRVSLAHWSFGRRGCRPDPMPGIALELMPCSCMYWCWRKRREPSIWQRKKEPP